MIYKIRILKVKNAGVYALINMESIKVCNDMIYFLYILSKCISKEQMEGQVMRYESECGRGKAIKNRGTVGCGRQK